MNAQILLAGDYTDQVTIRSNLINGDNCSAGDNVSFSHIEGKDSSTYSNYTHVDGISSTIDNSINSKILGNNSDITGSNNSIIIGHNSTIDRSPNSIVLGYANITGTGADVENNIVIGTNTTVLSGQGNLILASHKNSTDVSPNTENAIHLYTDGGLDDIYVNNVPFTQLTNTFGMKDVYSSLENTDGIAFITRGETSKYTIVSACVPPSGLAPEFDLRGSQRIMVKDYTETELTNTDSGYYSANIGYVNRKFDGVGIDGGSLSLTTSDLTSPGYYYLISIDKVNGSGIVVTGNTSIITTSNVEYHYNFAFELHVCNGNISSDTYVLNTNNLALFNNTIKCLYKTDGSYVYVYIQTSNASNTVSQLTLDLSVKHTAPSNAIFRKLEPSETITDGIYLNFDKSIIQSTGNKVAVDLTGSGSVKAPTVSLSNSKKTDYKNNVVTCGLLSEFTNGVVLLTGSQTISGSKTFTGDCIVNSIDISKNTTSTKAVNCSSLAKYLNNLGLSSGSTYVTIAGNQTITGEKTFSSKATFNGHIYSGNANGLNIVNSNNNKSSALRLYGGPDTNNGAEIILNSKAANGCWSIKAIDSNNNKILYGSPTTLTWGGKRVLTELDLDPINTRLTNIENLIGQINSVLEANVGWESETPPIQVDPLEEIFDNTFVYFCDRVDGFYTPKKTVPVTTECAIIGLTTAEEWCSATIKDGSSVFLKSSPYVHNTKISTISKTTLTLTCTGTYDWYAAAVAILCYVKDINVEQYFVNRNGSSGGKNTKTITINKDAVVVLVCGSGSHSNTYISVNGTKIITTSGVDNAHRVMRVKKNTTIELYCYGTSAWWAFAHVFVITKK